MKRVPKSMVEQWERLCKDIQSSTIVDTFETPAQQQARIKRAKKDYKFFFEYYFPHYAKSPCASFHIEFANAVKENKVIDVVFEAYRSSAKSTHAVLGTPIWLYINVELNGMIVVGDTDKKATKLLGTIQAEFQYNKRLIHDFGDQVSSGNWTSGEFSTKNGVGFYSLGLGSSPRGVKENEKRPDYILIDDADTKERCKNPKRVREAVEWILEDLRGCFDSADYAIERFVIANNRIHKNSILVNCLKDLPEAFHLKVNALDENGEPTWPSKTSKEYWEKKRKKTTYRSFQREYMNNPIEDGNIFLEEWIQYKKPLPLSEYDFIVGYADLSYTSTGDFKAMPIVCKKGKEYMVNFVFCQQSSTTKVVKWLYTTHEDNLKEVHPEYWYEGSFIQADFFRDDFDNEGEARGWYIPIRADKESKAKFQS